MKKGKVRIFVLGDDAANINLVAGWVADHLSNVTFDGHPVDVIKSPGVWPVANLERGDLQAQGFDADSVRTEQMQELSNLIYKDLLNSECYWLVLKSAAAKMQLPMLPLKKEDVFYKADIVWKKNPGKVIKGYWFQEGDSEAHRKDLDTTIFYWVKDEHEMGKLSQPDNGEEFMVVSYTKESAIILEENAG